MRIEIDANWVIDSDATAVTLYRLVTITGNAKTGRETKAENIGKIRESSEGSYGNLRDALVAYVNKSMRIDQSAVDLTNLISEIDKRILNIEKLAATFSAQVPAPRQTPSRPLSITPFKMPEPPPAAEPEELSIEEVQVETVKTTKIVKKSPAPVEVAKDTKAPKPAPKNVAVVKRRFTAR